MSSPSILTSPPLWMPFCAAIRCSLSCASPTTKGTSKSQKRPPRLLWVRPSVVEAEERGMPIYVLRANSVNQIEQFLTDLFNLAGSEHTIPGGSEEVRDQMQAAITAVMNGERYVDMPPASPIIRRIQHEMARDA